METNRQRNKQKKEKGRQKRKNEIIYLELSPPSQSDIAGEVYRGSYRSRGRKGQGPGGSWRYIAGELYSGSYRSGSQKGQGPGGSWRYAYLPQYSCQSQIHTLKCQHESY